MNARSHSRARSAALLVAKTSARKLARPAAAGTAAADSPMQKKPLTMEDYERFVHQIEPSMTLVHESAHTRTYLSEHPVPCVQRIRRIDGSIVERHTEREIGAQIQAYRENGAAGFRVRWFYPR